MKRRPLTEPEIAQARQWKAEGQGYIQISQVFGCQPETVKRALDPVFAEKRREQVRRNRMGQKDNPVHAKARGGHEVYRAKATPKDVVYRVAEIPADTRSLTARLLGDPLPGRSALDSARSAR